MADVSVELHALEDEILSFLSDITREFELYISEIQFPPYTIKQIDPNKLQNAVFDKKVIEIALTTSPLSLPEEAIPRPLQSRFREHNPDSMSIHLGRLTERGLEESWLTARTFDPVILDTWKRVARKLRSRTKVGAIAINPETGASGKLRAHRFTEGAMRLQEQGVTMLPFAGGSVIRLGG